MKKWIFIIIAVLFFCCNVYGQINVKVKNLVSVEGLNENSIMGYGLVTGLNGTGDSKKFNVSQIILTRILNNLGIDLDDVQLNSKNNALVFITSKLPPNVKAGEKIDVGVASMGDSRNIAGGMLLQAPMKGMDNKTYAVAEGVISVSDGTKKNQASGIIPSGAVLAQDFSSDIIKNNKLIFTLNSPDFNTVIKIRDIIIENFSELQIEVINNKIIEINLTDDHRKNISELISKIENLEVVPETTARIVINKNSGVIVISGDIKLLESAVSYKNIDIVINRNLKQDEAKNVFYLDESSDIQSLIDGLNKLGAKTEDIISILYSLKKAGALFADIVVN
ncbi:MAG: flagellar basal body P-ring protein FlgI [Spirochaetes bacterium]|nr:flagellar basal body P-ring protein FlgI [Spirochaetota bacterium]